MKTKTVVIILAFSAFTIALGAAVHGVSQATPQTKRQIAVDVMRIINTAEVSHAFKFGRFAALNEFDTAELRTRSRKAAIPAIDPRAGENAVPGFSLHITVAADGKSYAVKLQDKDSGNCGTDAFSDNEGVIYLAGPIDCNFDVLQPYSSQ